MPTPRLRVKIGFIATIAFLAGVSPSTAYATPTTDAANDFIGTYAGPTAGDVDVLSTNVTLLGSGDYFFTATLNGAVGTTAGAFYVWGVDRGRGASTSSFAAIGLPNVIFDTVVILRPDGTGSVNRLGGGGSSTLSAGAITILGNTISGTVPGSFLPSNGFVPSSYTYNLWPRVGAGNNNQISDFAPNASNAAVTTVPEASSAALALVGAVPFFGVLRVARRRARRIS